MDGNGTYVDNVDPAGGFVTKAVPLAGAGYCKARPLQVHSETTL